MLVSLKYNKPRTDLFSVLPSILCSGFQKASHQILSRSVCEHKRNLKLQLQLQAKNMEMIHFVIFIPTSLRRFNYQWKSTWKELTRNKKIANISQDIIKRMEKLTVLDEYMYCRYGLKYTLFISRWNRGNS